ncbi:class I SAM-dependent methyltransferase [Mesorhizobium loti]|uniref:Class I SAM-dependent methyltransferase n=1 Tax=Mesorhizobium loti R88b TaxID=935548 RepID=A0A6M7WG12_RHILI|nr:class I SAM-dependent methyltransferase [Mesorhizobium loti]QKD01432.1 class I SAM-dependent methyltransferase [Mesorhizobium loti R88b]
MTDRLYSDPDLVQFYDIENIGGDDFNYCVGFAEDARSVLDLGCGTGQLAAALSHGRSVTGVDPASPMLDVGRSRPGGDKVDWIEGDARTVRLGRRFDLVLLTGHAFQVFLTPEDQSAVLRTIAEHLAPDGLFIFDSRNPVANEWQEWTPRRSERIVMHPSLGAVKSWNDFECDAVTGIVTYSTFYEIPGGDKILGAESKIAFPAKEDLARMLNEAGLLVEQWLGNWHGESYVDSAPEIIPIGRLR